MATGHELVRMPPAKHLIAVIHRAGLKVVSLHVHVVVVRVNFEDVLFGVPSIVSRRQLRSPTAGNRD